MAEIVKYSKLVVVLLITSCTLNNNIQGETEDVIELNKNDYAKYFSIGKDDSGTNHIIINEDWGSQNNRVVYRLISRLEEVQKSDSNFEAKDNDILIPVQKIVCMSTSHIAYISKLNSSESIVAVSGAKYVSDSTVRELYKKGEIWDIGYEAYINYEMLLKLKPDLVLTYGISGENNLYIQKIRDLGIKVIAVGDYMENHPLGKAEYLKFFGYLLGKERMADSVYISIKESYIRATERLASADINAKPKVLLNAPWKDHWYIPGENNYMSILVKDAGGEVILTKPGDMHSFANSVEEVLREAYKADFWINPNFINSMSELRSINPIFSKIPAFIGGKIYNNTKRRTPEGGSDFWERGVIEPHEILDDLIDILHPELSGGRELKYYIKLK